MTLKSSSLKKLVRKKVAFTDPTQKIDKQQEIKKII
jgi:hypothetical protein